MLFTWIWHTRHSALQRPFAAPAAALARAERRGEAQKSLEDVLARPDKFPSRPEAERLLSQLQGGSASGT